MHRRPEIFLAGCSSAEPASACFRQNKYSDISLIFTRIKQLKRSVDKYFREPVVLKFKEKKYQKKKEEMEWAIAHNLIIRFS